MHLTINGEVQAFEAPMTVAALLARLAIDRRKVAVERNLALVQRGSFDTVLLEDGDRIEIVAFIGGGM